MKFTVSFLLLLLPALAFADLRVQNGKISADLNSEALTTVLDELKQQSHIKVNVDPEVGNQTISASFQDVPLAAGIKKLLEGTGINYVLIGDGEAPTSLFLGGSEKPGGSPRVLDSRGPMPGRGVVQPVTPLPPMPPPPQPGAATKQDNQKKPATSPPVNVPTGGGFVPNNNSNQNGNDPNRPQMMQQTPQIPPEEQAPEDDEDQQQQQ